MKLFNPDYHIEFQLLINRYQFPAIEDEWDDYDVNWLMIQVNVAFEELAWTATSPCLLTYEFHKLINWFEPINKGELIEKKLKFIEPELEFHLVLLNNEWLIRVILQYNLTLGYQSGKDLRDLTILDFPLSKNPCSGIIRLLKQEMAKYPIRKLK